MIICFSGLPGGGKSYSAVKKILDNLKAGKRVYTNIDGFDDDEVLQYIKVYCDLDDYDLEKRLVYMDNKKAARFYEFVKDGSLIVLDEVHLLFSNREWSTEKNNEFAKWASVHRHRGFNLLLITQDIEKVEKHIRTLIQWTHVFRKIDYLGSKFTKGFHEYAYHGYEVSGKAIKTFTRKYDPLVFNCYKSYVSDDIKEQGFMVTTNILKHPIFFAIPVIFCCFLYMLFAKSSFATGDIFGAKKLNESAEKRSKEFAQQNNKVVPVFKNASAHVVTPLVNYTAVRNYPVFAAPAAVIVKGYVEITQNEYFVTLSDGTIAKTKTVPIIGKPL